MIAIKLKPYESCYLIILVILLIANPFIATVVTVVYAATMYTRRNGYLAVTVLSIFLTLWNINQVWESDTLGYSKWFKDYLNIGFARYMMLKKGQEPVFFFTNYMWGILTNSWAKMYFFIYSLLFYYFFLRSIYIFADYHKQYKAGMVVAIIFIFFYPPAYLGTMQLLRQSLVGSMFVFYLVRICYTNPSLKWKLIFGFFMVGMHSSVIVPYAISFIPINVFKRNRYNLMLVAFCMVIGTVVIRLAPSLLGNGETAIGTIAVRGDLSVVTKAERLTGTALVSYIMLIFFVIISFIKTYTNKQDWNYHVVVLAFVLWIAMLPYNSFVQARMSVYLLYFIPNFMLIVLGTRNLFPTLFRGVIITACLLGWCLYVIGGHAAKTYPPVSFAINPITVYLTDPQK